MAIVAVRSRAQTASCGAVVVAAAMLAVSAGAASTWAILDPEEELVLILMSQYMVADADFAGRFQTLAYQALVD